MQQFADDLYAQARWIELWTALKYGFVVTVIFTVIIGAYNLSQEAKLAAVLRLPTYSRPNTGTAEYADVTPGFSIIPGLIASIFGAAAGKRKSFLLRLEAQRTLCQMQIEANTRNSQLAAGVATSPV